MCAFVRALPFDYTSYQIDISKLNQAIETLEGGRSLLWAEMCSLCPSINQIRFVDPHLADNLVMVNRHLETLTLAADSPENIVDGGDSNIERTDPFGDFVVWHWKLLDDCKKLIVQIQALPGFNTFLKSPSFNTLHEVACHGPVIIINHSIWHSDIIILLHNSPSSLISTSIDFFKRTRKLQDQLLGE